MGACKTFFKEKFLGIDVEQEVNIPNPVLGIFRAITVLAALGVIGWRVFEDQNYNQYDYAKGYTTIAISGVARALNGSLTYKDERIFDVTDVSIATVEGDSYFVMTNWIVTQEQIYGKCEEDNAIAGANCTLDNICERGRPLESGNGFMTGKCIDSKRYEGQKSCEVNAWCPTEDLRVQPPNPPELSDVSNFTVSIRNLVEFPSFNFKRNNTFKIDSEHELETCRYDEDDEENKFCPNFVIKDILTYAEVSNINDIAVSGGDILITINWNCNMHITNECLPKYSFRRVRQRIDGIYYRFARYYENDNTHIVRRSLFKAFGIKFIVQTQGEAYEFKLLKLLLTLGSSFGVIGFINDSFTKLAKITKKCCKTNKVDEGNRSSSKTETSGGKTSPTGTEETNASGNRSSSKTETSGGKTSPTGTEETNASINSMEENSNYGSSSMHAAKTV